MTATLAEEIPWNAKLLVVLGMAFCSLVLFLTVLVLLGVVA